MADTKNNASEDVQATGETKGGEPAPDTLLDRLDRWCNMHPDKILYTFVGTKMKEEASLTYAQVEVRTRDMARRLVTPTRDGGWGVNPGDRVLLVYPPSLDFIMAYIACLRAGVVAVPVFPPIPGKLRKDLYHFASIQASSGANVALTSSWYKWAKRVEDIKGIFKKKNTSWPEVRWVVTDKDAASSRASLANLPTAIPRTDLCFLQYTSGSTSEPKGVMVTHDNLAHNLCTIVTALEASETTRVVSWLPQYHDMGLIGSYLGTLYCGGSGYYMSPITFIKDPVQWVRMMSTYKATHVQSPNFGYKLTARKFRALSPTPDLDLSSLQHMFNAAEPVTIDAVTDFVETFTPHGLPSTAMVPGYGLAEHTVYVCDGGSQRLWVKKSLLAREHRAEIIGAYEKEAPEPEDAQLIMGCGVPARMPGVDVRIVDRESLQQLPERQVGEIWINSPSKAGGYFGKAELSDSVFRARISVPEVDTTKEEGAPEEAEQKIAAPAPAEDGYLRTGDLGFLHEGELFVCGREKDLIIIRGKNHYPQDIERTVEDDLENRVRPGNCAAFSVSEGSGASTGGGPGECKEEVLIVVAELRNPKLPGAELFAAELRSIVAQDHGVGVQKMILVKPRTIEKTSSGKIARQWVRKAYLSGGLKIVAEASGEVAVLSARAGGPSSAPGSGDSPVDAAAQSTSDLEQRICTIAADHSEGLIDPATVDVTTPLVELGLTSMQYVQMTSQIGEDFGVELDEEELNDPGVSLRTIAQMVERAQGTPADAGQKGREGADAQISAPTATSAAPTQPGNKVGQKRNRKKNKKSTFQIVFCWCCSGNSMDKGQQARAQAAYDEEL